MAVAGVHKIEELYKAAAGLRIAKNKVKNLSDFIDDKFHDMLIVGKANTKANGREIIAMSDLPFGKAFREEMRRFTDLEITLNLQEILDHIATLPPAYELDAETEKALPEIVGTLIVVLAKITKELSRDDNVVSEKEHEAAERIMNLVL